MVDIRYLPRFASGLLKRALDMSPVAVLMGARQTGKSTLAQSEPFLADRLYLTLDDPETHERARLAARDLVRSTPRSTLDEVQREPDLLLAVKRAVDEDRPRRNGRFVLTGSANLLLMRRVSETLAGRAVYVNLWPLTRRGGIPTPSAFEPFGTSTRNASPAACCSTAAARRSGCPTVFSVSPGGVCCRRLVYHLREDRSFPTTGMEHRHPSLSNTRERARSLRPSGAGDHTAS